MVNIAIVGSRDFNNIQFLENKIMSYLANKEFYEINIVSGGARGADTLAEILANKYGFKTIIFKPDWNLYGKSAGFIRNRKIVENCDILFAFQINKSKGTQHSINLAKELGKEVYVFEIEELHR